MDILKIEKKSINHLRNDFSTKITAIANVFAALSTAYITGAM